MSWSYYKKGRSEVVRKDAAERLAKIASGLSINSEAAIVSSFAASIDAICEQAAGQAVVVEATGSAWLENGVLRSHSFSAKIDVVDLTETAS